MVVCDNKKISQKQGFLNLFASRTDELSQEVLGRKMSLEPTKSNNLTQRRQEHLTGVYEKTLRRFKRFIRTLLCNNTR